MSFPGKKAELVRPGGTPGRRGRELMGADNPLDHPRVARGLRVGLADTVSKT